MNQEFKNYGVGLLRRGGGGGGGRTNIAGKKWT